MMKTICVLWANLLLSQVPLCANDVAPMRDVQIYAKSKWIVVGTLQEDKVGKAFAWTIKVDEMIKGEKVESLSVVPNKWELGDIVSLKKPMLFAVGEFEGKNYVLHPSWRDAIKGKEVMEAARKLLADPKAAILDLKAAPNVEVVRVIGNRFAPDQKVATYPVGREAAVAYLRHALQSDDGEMVIEVLQVLKEIEDKLLEPEVRKMLRKETEAWFVRPMVHYLKQTGSPQAIQHFEALLRATAPEYPRYHSISDYCAEALNELGHPGSLPVLEEGARHGVQRAIEALISHGTVDSFDMLYATYLKAREPGSQPNALHWLVRRSNRPVEAWMHPSRYNTAAGIKMKDKWTAWWKEHREGFEIVRTFEEARVEWEKERGVQ